MGPEFLVNVILCHVSDGFGLEQCISGTIGHGQSGAPIEFVSPSTSMAFAVLFLMAAAGFTQIFSESHLTCLLADQMCQLASTCSIHSRYYLQSRYYCINIITFTVTWAW
jgi:hypothetical protein